MDLDILRQQFDAFDKDKSGYLEPGEAVAAGADHLVIGRPITRSDDPVGSARPIVH